MDWNKIVQGGLAGLALTIFFQINQAYTALHETIRENTRVNTELLVLHRTWFATNQRNSRHEIDSPSNPAPAVETSSNNGRHDLNLYRNGR